MEKKQAAPVVKKVKAEKKKSKKSPVKKPAPAIPIMSEYLIKRRKLKS